MVIVMNTSCFRLLPTRLTMNTITIRTIGFKRIPVSCRIRDVFRLLNEKIE